MRERKKEKRKEKESINVQCYSEHDNCVHESYSNPLDLPVAIQLAYIIRMRFSVTTSSA